ncbi:MAG TPA: hypothetical protein DCF68_09760 [Cyanothece sp. UBA12306]|nr:hypothetical protein [Cyanothece sp. UBA12306]
MSVLKQLEQYTIQNPQEILLVTLEIKGESDQIMIFKGFSSSLVKSTNFDPDVPIFPEESTILSVDRLESPYNLYSPKYLDRGLSWEQMQAILAERSQ